MSPKKVIMRGTVQGSSIELFTVLPFVRFGERAMKVYKLKEEQLIKLLFESFELYHKYLLQYGGDVKCAKYAAASQAIAMLSGQYRKPTKALEKKRKAKDEMLF
jgi:hypothetical protein